MDFFAKPIEVLQTLVIALGGGCAYGAASTFWKVTARTTLLPKAGYETVDGRRRCRLIGITLVPLLSGLFG